MKEEGNDLVLEGVLHGWHKMTQKDPTFSVKMDHLGFKTMKQMYQSGQRKEIVVTQIRKLKGVNQIKEKKRVIQIKEQKVSTSSKNKTGVNQNQIYEVNIQHNNESKWDIFTVVPPFKCGGS